MEGFNEQIKKMSIATLEDEHRNIFVRALINVLSSQIAEITYGQIVDGLPLSSVACDVYSYCVCYGHPFLKEHKELCPGVVEHLRRLGTDFDVGALQMDPGLINQFQSAPPGSSEFNTRLIELVARAVHQVAAWLYKQDTNRHKDDALGLWRPPEEGGWYYPPTFPSTLFCHEWYRDYEQYPEGIASCVGYWAEARIFGGVVLFDRRDPGSVPDVTPDAVYFHADRRDVIYRICRLLDGQKQDLLQFMLSDPDTAPPPECPLPILPGKNNQQRVDPETDIKSTGIFRDPWERRVRVYTTRRIDPDADPRVKDVIDLFNYVSSAEYHQAGKRAYREQRKRVKREQRERREKEQRERREGEQQPEGREDGEGQEGEEMDYQIIKGDATGSQFNPWPE